MWCSIAIGRSLIVRSSLSRIARSHVGGLSPRSSAFQHTVCPTESAHAQQLTTYVIDGGEEGPLKSPSVHEDAWVAPSAVVVGDVEIGARSSVWFGATIRGDRDKIKIGEETNIQDGSVLHTDPGIKLELGDQVTIGHGVMLHGCTVNSGSLIGIGAIILNNAVIGRGCLIGAGATVTENKVIPDGSLVIGTNKIVRQLSEAEIQGLQRNAANYVQNQARYRKTLRKTK